MIHGAAWGDAIDEPDMRANAAAGDRQARLAPTPAATPAMKAMGVGALAMDLIIAHHGRPHGRPDDEPLAQHGGAARRT